MAPVRLVEDIGWEANPHDRGTGDLRVALREAIGLFRHLAGTTGRGKCKPFPDLKEDEFR